MKPVLVSECARKDLLEIADFVSGDQPAAGHRLLEAAFEEMERLAANPEIGRLRPSAAYDCEVRLWLLPRFRFCVMVYRVGEDAVELLRVLHAARDVDALLD